MIFDKKMDPQVVKMIEASQRSGLKRIGEMSVLEARAQYAGTSLGLDYPEVTKVSIVEDIEIDLHTRRVMGRLYKPMIYNRLNSLPLLLFFHGGGHVVGGLDSHDSALRSICNLSSCAIMSVDYRLAPEHRFPAAVEDAFDSLKWIVKNSNELEVDPKKIAVGGDSAGGNLAAVCALLARDCELLNLCFQLLIYPVVDLTCQHDSHKKYGAGYGVLDTQAINWFINQYIPLIELRTDWRASPIYANSHVDLPSALILLAELDMLYDEGVAYHKKLVGGGVDSELFVSTGMVHGFFRAGNILEGAVTAQVKCANVLRLAFGIE